MENLEKKLAMIHDASMRILEKTGMRFLHPEVLSILKKNGIKVEGQIAYFTEEQIMSYIKKAPSEFVINARNPRYNMTVGNEHVYFLPGTGPAQIVDKDHIVKKALLKDYIKLIKLYHQNQECPSNAGASIQPQDLDPKHRMSLSAFLSLSYSDKILDSESIEDPTQGTLDGEQSMQLLKIAFGLRDQSLKETPVMLGITNTNSPLQFDQKMLDMLLVCAKYRQPLIVASCSMAGTTGPVTLAGNLALTNAEVLSGIALMQMISPGTPSVYGCQSATADMRTGRIATGAAESALIYAYSAKLAKMYRLPCRGGGALTDSKLISAQSGYESMLTLFATAMAETNIIYHSSGILDSYALFSFEKMILDFEMIRYLERFRRGMSIDEDTLAVDIINEVGIGGEFITHEHTLEFMREEAIFPKTFLRNGKIKGHEQELGQRVEKEIQSLLESYTVPDFDPAVRKDMVGYLETIGIDSHYSSALLQQ